MRGRISESVLRLKQGFDSTEQVSHAVAFWHDCRYTENLGEGFAEKIFKHREDHDGRFRHADVKPCRNFYPVRNRHPKVQNYKIRLEGFRFVNCFVAVNGLANLELGSAFNEGPYGVSNGSLVLGNENALGHGYKPRKSFAPQRR